MAHFVHTPHEEPIDTRGLLSPDDVLTFAQWLLRASLVALLAVGLLIESCRGDAEPHTHPHPSFAIIHEVAGAKHPGA